MKYIYSILTLCFLTSSLIAQHNQSGIKGYVLDRNEKAIVNAEIILDNTTSVYTNNDGYFEFLKLASGDHTIIATGNDHNSYSKALNLDENEILDLKILLSPQKSIEKITVVGKNKVPGLDQISRLPLTPREMAQNISIIPEEVIKDQGASSITDVVKNVPGVTLFGSYGGVKESMSIRGYRGVPVLKNGIQLDSDFRTASILTEISGIDNVQVLKGSAAISQGIGNGLGSPGGVINVVTKTPKFTNKGEVALSTGSWGLFRTTLDYQTVLDKKQTAAFRINGAFQRKDSYKSYVDNNRVYVNPSFEWKPNSKTTITLEADYFNDNTTPDRGTVNLTTDDTYALYEVPHNKFLGWSTDNVNTTTTTYSAKVVRELNDNLSLRVVYAGASNEVENVGVSLSTVRKNGVIDYNLRSRTLAKSGSTDKNQAIQIDLIGKNFYTGIIKHSFNTGFDYKTNKKTSIAYSSISAIDVINVLEPISNKLPSQYSNSNLTETGRTTTKSDVFGITAQEVMEFDKYVRAIIGLRYSQNTKREDSDGPDYSWDPFIGLMITPIENFSIFGNFATTSDLRSSHNPTQDGGTVGTATSKQFEVGLKTDWFNKQLGLNVTYFNIRNNDLSYQVYENGVVTNYYAKAGDITRQGVDVEISGNIMPQLKVIAGYSYLDSQYQNSPSYVNGSRPMNAPQNTANGWVQYTFDKGVFNNLSLAAGVYYVGNRPVNDYSLKNDGHGTVPGTKPFNMPEYTTVNLQFGYKYKQVNLNLFIDNLFDELGYTSYYRGGYINQIDPRNFRVQVAYNF